MRYFDAAVIGGGVLGCFAARNLRRWNISAVLIEAREDVCMGITRANSAIVYSGCDHRHGSLKAEMSVRTNAAFEQLSQDLEVPFFRCGSLMTATGPEGEAVLQKKLKQGMKNGVPGLRILDRASALEKEPMLSPAVTAALYAPSTGTTNPWQLGIAAYENALSNGCEAMLNAPMRGIRREGNGYIVETDGGDVRCRVVINCGGMQADRIHEMVCAPSVRIMADASDYILLSDDASGPSHVIMEETEGMGKGISAVPTVDGRLMLASPPRQVNGPYGATDEKSLARLRTRARALLPHTDVSKAMRAFAAVRPNPYSVVEKNGEYVPDGKSIHGFAIENAAPGFYSLIGVKTPGLTCGEELGLYLAGRAAGYLGAERRKAFDPRRKAILRTRGMDFESRAALAAKDPAFAEVVCRCEDITRGEIIEAVRRGAVTVEGVKRRVGSGMGPCQGSRCGRLIEEILEGYLNGKL